MRRLNRSENVLILNRKIKFKYVEREYTCTYMGIIDVLRMREVFCTKLQNTIIYYIISAFVFPFNRGVVNMKYTANIVPQRSRRWPHGKLSRAIINNCVGNPYFSRTWLFLFTRRGTSDRVFVCPSTNVNYYREGM